MSASLASDVRPAAAAGRFYPADPGELGFQVDRLMVRARGGTPFGATPPKAIVVPHAGYRSSGSVAADAYARLGAAADRISRVVLVGPAHGAAIEGMAVPSVSSFETPLGHVPIDLEAVQALSQEPGVIVSDEAHRDEHCLEVQLPFLQSVLGRFRLVPILVGRADPGRVGALIDRLWGGPETLVIVSSDLSHDRDYEAAKRLDASTCAVVETLNAGKLDGHMACGALPLDGLLRVARRRDMRATTLAMRSSGDSVGHRRRGVGYGAWAFSPNVEAGIDVMNRRALLSAAVRTLQAGAARGRRPNVGIGTFEREIECLRASFVTLEEAGRLRGCVGSFGPSRPLVADVVWNAFSAGFADPRFPPVGAAEIDRLTVSISVLGVALRLHVADEAALSAALRPGLDGLVLAHGSRRGLFLPAAWARTADPAEFVRRLKRKAGLAADEWPDGIRAFRFTTETFGADVSDIAT